MSDILQDARDWLAAVPARIGTHWPDCHTDRHHAPCLVRKLADEIERLRLTPEEASAIAGASEAYANRHRQGVGLENDTPIECEKIAATLAAIVERLG